MKTFILALLFFSSISFGSYVVQNGSVTQIKLAQRPVGTTVGLGGIATGTSSSTFSFTGTETLVTNQTFTITTNGRPVMVSVQDLSQTGAAAQTPGSSQIVVATLRVKRGGSTIAAWVCGETPATTASAVTINCNENFSYIDQPVAGTYTYTLTQQLTGGGGGSTATSGALVMVIYEI